MKRLIFLITIISSIFSTSLMITNVQAQQPNASEGIIFSADAGRLNKKISEIITVEQVVKRKVSTKRKIKRYTPTPDGF